LHQSEHGVSSETRLTGRRAARPFVLVLRSHVNRPTRERNRSLCHPSKGASPAVATPLPGVAPSDRRPQAATESGERSRHRSPLLLIRGNFGTSSPFWPSSARKAFLLTASARLTAHASAASRAAGVKRGGRAGDRWRRGTPKLPEIVGSHCDRLVVVLRPQKYATCARFEHRPFWRNDPASRLRERMSDRVAAHKRADAAMGRPRLRSTAEREPRVALAGSENHDRRPDPDTIV
jgi:hypothetical protein